MSESEKVATLRSSRSEMRERLERGPKHKSGRGFEQVPEHADAPLRLVHHHPGYLRIQADAFVNQVNENAGVKAAQIATVDGVMTAPVT